MLKLKDILLQVKQVPQNQITVQDEGYTASFVAISPTENPEIVLLVTSI